MNILHSVNKELELIYKYPLPYARTAIICATNSVNKPISLIKNFVNSVTNKIFTSISEIAKEIFIKEQILKDMKTLEDIKAFPPKTEMLIRNLISKDHDKILFVTDTKIDSFIPVNMSYTLYNYEFHIFKRLPVITISSKTVESIEKEGKLNDSMIELIQSLSNFSNNAPDKTTKLVRNFFIEKNINASKILIFKDKDALEGDFSSSTFTPETSSNSYYMIQIPSKDIERIEREGKLSDSDKFILCHEYAHITHGDIEKRREFSKNAHMIYFAAQAVSVLSDYYFGSLGYLTPLKSCVFPYLIISFFKNWKWQTKELQADATAAKFGKDILEYGKQWTINQNSKLIKNWNHGSSYSPSGEFLCSLLWLEHPSFLKRYAALKEIEKEYYSSNFFSSSSSLSIAESSSIEADIKAANNFFLELRKLNDKIEGSEKPSNSREHIARIWSFYLKYEGLAKEFPNLTDSEKKELDFLKKMILVQLPYDPSSQFESVLRRTMNAVTYNTNPKERESLIKDLKSLDKPIWECLIINPTFKAMMATTEGQRLSKELLSSEIP